MMLGVNLREAFNSEIRLKFEFEPFLTYCTLQQIGSLPASQ